MPFSEREARARQALRGLRERPLPEIPRYEIRALLGEGASASVYRAWDRELGREVALKVLRGGRSGERFRREARAVAALSHPNVVAVHDAGEADGRLYLVLELVEGGPLRTRLREPDAAALLEQAARGVAAAHARGLVHRDVTPANILVSHEGAPKVADFGLVHEDAAEALTATGAALGTPPYMAPEQVEGRGVSPATDVYALGAILYEILAGHPPFTASTPHALYAKILDEPPAPLAGPLGAVAAQALAKRPSDRYPDAGAFADDLRRALDGRPVLARPPGPLRRALRHWKVLAAALLLAAVALVVRRRESDLARAMSLLESARLEASEEAIDEALRLAPRLPLAHFRRGEAHEARGRDEEAEASWRRARELDPRFGPARFRLGQALLRRAYLEGLDLGLEPPEAARARAERRTAEAVAEIEAAEGLDQELQRALAAAMLASLRKDVDLARRLCAEGVRRWPQDADFHWLAGTLAESAAGRRAAFDAALAIRPRFPLALLSRSRERHYGRDPEGALADLTAAIEASPTFAEAYLRRGSLRFNGKDAPGALADFERLIALGKLLPGAYNGRGVVRLELLGDVEGALADFDEAIRLNSDYFYLPFYFRAKARAKQGDASRARADVDRALELAPRSGRPDVLHLRAALKRQAGDVAGARSDLEEVLKLSPSHEAARKDFDALR